MGPVPVAVYLLVITCTDVHGLVNGLRGRHLLISAVHFPPTIHVVQSNGSFHFSGALVEQVDWLSKRLRFSYTLTAGPNNALGVEEKGNWTGLMGQLKRNEVDLGVFPFTVSLQRFQVLNFVAYVAGDNVGILVKYPQSQSSWTASLEPFSIQVWIGWIMSLCAMAGACFASVHIRFVLYKLTKMFKMKTLDDMFVYIFGVITAQGGYYRRGNRDVAVLATTWCLAASVFVYVYNCTLVSFLATSYKSPETNSLQLLANSSTYQVVTLKGTASETSLLTATTGPSRVLGDKLLQCPDCRMTSMDNLAKRIAEGPYAGVVTSATCNDMIKNDYEATKTCRLTLAYERANWKPQFLGVSKSSSFTEEFNREALWAHAFGFPYKWKSYPADFKPCMLNYNRNGVEVKSQNRPLELRIFYSAFLLLLTGYGLAFVLFFYERVRYRLMKRSAL